MDDAGGRGRGRALALLPAERDDEARLVEVALAADRAGLRPLERAARGRALLRDVHAALQAGGCEVEALAALDLRSRRADEERAPESTRRRLHTALVEEAGRLGRPTVAAAGRARLAAVDAEKKRLAGARKRVDAAQRRRDELGDAAHAEARTLVEASPLEARAWLDLHHLGGRLRPGGFDALTVAFELDAGATLDYACSFDPRNLAPEAAVATRASIAGFAAPSDPDPTLPAARDEALRLALGGHYALEARCDLSPGAVRACHAAAVDFALRRPDSPGAALTLGRLQVAVGDHAGALVTLERAADDELAWSLLYRALAHGGLRRWDEARRCLEALVALPARKRLAIRGHRLLDEPLLKDAPGWTHDLARALDPERR